MTRWKIPVKSLRKYIDSFMVDVPASHLSCFFWGVNMYQYIFPIASMNGIFTYIYHKNQTNVVGKYTSPMDGMGLETPPNGAVIFWFPRDLRIRGISKPSIIFRGENPKSPKKTTTMFLRWWTKSCKKSGLCFFLWISQWISNDPTVSVVFSNLLFH